MQIRSTLEPVHSFWSLSSSSEMDRAWAWAWRLRSIKLSLLKFWALQWLNKWSE